MVRRNLLKSIGHRLLSLMVT